MSMELMSPGEFVRVDTADLPVRERFNFWRAVHNNLDMSVVEAARVMDYRARLVTAAAGDGVRFGYSTSPGTRTRFGDDSHDLVLLSFTLSGAMGIRDGHDDTKVITADSGPILLDMRRQAVTTTLDDIGHHGHVYLGIPRDLADRAAGGRDAVGGRKALRTLGDARLAPFLKAQMGMLLAHGETLDPEEARLALGVATQLALACIGQASAVPVVEDDHSAHRALYSAACRYLDLRHGQPDLTAMTVAAALGCSRAHLYRVFAAHGTSVGQMLRDIRLDKGRLLIERGGTGLEQVARIAGYGSAASFGRAFRERYGLSPGEWNKLSNETPDQEI